MAMLSVVLLVIRQIYCHRKYDEVVIGFKKYSDNALFKKMTSFASWSFLGASTSMIANYGQAIVLNSFFGTTVNAAQGISGQVSGQLSSFAGVMLKALNPLIDKSEGAGDRSLMLKASSIGSKISFFLLIIFYIPVLVEMPYIFNLWLKEVPDYAILFCRLLLLRNLIEQLFLTLSSSIAAVGNIRKFQLYSSILNVFPLVVCYIMFYFGFEPETLYFVFITYAVINGMIILKFAQKECGLNIVGYLKDVVLRCSATFLLSLFSTYIISTILDKSLLNLLFLSILSAIILIACIYSIGLVKEEKIVFKNVFYNLSKKFNLF